MRIIVFGDSITQGLHDLEKGGWCNRLHIYCMNVAVTSDWEKDASVFNLGIVGDSLDKLDRRFDTEFNRRKGSECLTIFAYGINDSMSDKEGNYRVEPEEFVKLYATYIAKAAEAGKVALIGLAPVDDSVLDPIPWFTSHSYLEKNRQKYDNLIQDLARQHNCIYVSLNDMFGDDIAGHTSDGIHPNAEGHRLIFERVKQALEANGIL